MYYNKAFETTFRLQKLEHVHALFLSDRISMDEILEKPSQHLMVFRPSMTELDFGGTLPTGSRCLYSRWEGYLTNPEWIELKKDLATVEGDFIPFHTSGHIFVNDLIELVRAIAFPTRV